MEVFLNSAFGLIVLGGGVISVAIVGGLYVAGLIKGKKDDAAGNLIDILQKTVEEMEKKVDKQRIDIDELTTEVEELRKDNKRYIDILQGRDAQTQKFYEAAFESMRVSKETHALVLTMATGMQNTNTNIEKLIELMSKHADVLDHSITKK